MTYKERRDLCMAQGTCVLCGEVKEPNRTNYVACQTCQDIQTVIGRKGREKMKQLARESGGTKCNQCGLKKENIWFKACTSCRQASATMTKKRWHDQKKVVAEMRCLLERWLLLSPSFATPEIFSMLTALRAETEATLIRKTGNKQKP